MCVEVCESIYHGNNICGGTGALCVCVCVCVTGDGYAKNSTFLVIM